jgi:hypothetical protein
MDADGSEVEFVGQASNFGGIRAIRMSESLESFLRAYCAEDPGVVKRLVANTWVVIEGGTVAFPLTV